jgi:hypothetical protein
MKTLIEKMKALRLYFVIVRLFTKKYKCEIKTNTMVKFDYETMPKEYHDSYLKVFPKDEVFVFMGELEQMQGHCILCNFKTGKIVCGYHTDNFRILTDDEV